MMPSRTVVDSNPNQSAPFQQTNESLQCQSPKDVEQMQKLQTIIGSLSSGSTLSDDQSKLKEKYILELASLFKSYSLSDKLSQLLLSLTDSVQNNLNKAKTAKLVRLLMDEFDLSDSVPLQIETCQKLLVWCQTERRDILKRSLEAILIKRYLSCGSFSEAISLITSLSKELKKLDDKVGLMEVQLLESRTFFHLKNIPKAKAALTSARASANSIFCPPNLQAALDMQSGILHAEEKDFKTAYSYFYEAFDAYFNMSNYEAIHALKYMILCKIMLNSTDEIQAILAGKSAIKYSGPSIDALKQIAVAYKNRSLAQFDLALKSNKAVLLDDPIICSHLTDLYETLLEQNILRVVEPYTVIEVEHIAKVVGLERSMIEKKISQMILDNVLFGVIDEGNGCLELYEIEPKNVTFENLLGTVQQADLVLDALFEKSKKIL